MIVIADSSPLIALSAIGQQELLRQLFETIVMPTAVVQELSTRSDEPNRQALLGAAWTHSQAPANIDLVNALQQTLGAGEAEAIALAIEIDAAFLIIDERLGRRTATRFGIKQIGTLGILVEAKRRGYVDAVRPLIQQLQRQAGFRVSDALVARVLADCGEE